MRRIHELVQIIFIFSQNLFMLTQVFASAVFGIDAVPITIEVHIDAGIGYHLVGLPDNAVKESNYRIADCHWDSRRGWTNSANPTRKLLYDGGVDSRWASSTH
jgi:hypothetical protein